MKNLTVVFGRYYWPKFVFGKVKNLLFGVEMKNSLGGKELPLGFFGQYLPVVLIWYLAR